MRSAVPHVRTAFATLLWALLLASLFLGLDVSGADSNSVSSEWIYTWTGPMWDWAVGLALEGSNVYAAGHISETTPDGSFMADGLLVKIRSNGRQAWNYTLGRGGFDEFKDVAYWNGYAYVVGYYEPAERAPGDAVIVKLTGEGEEVWRRTWKGNTDEVLYSVYVYGGYVYAAGDTTHPVSRRGSGWSPAGLQEEQEEWKMKGLILKYDLEGQYVWHKILDLGGMTSLGDIRVQDRWMYVVGFAETGEGGEQRDILVAKLSPEDGSLVWAYTWDGGCDERARRMEVVNGAIYVAGTKSCQSSSLPTAVLLKLDLDGNLVWEREWTGDGGAFYSAVWSDGSVIYVVGGTASSPSAPWPSVVISAYSQDGQLLWSRKVMRPKSTSAVKGIPLDLVRDGDYLYIAGRLGSPREGDPEDAMVVKVPLEVEEEGEQGAGETGAADLLTVTAPEVALVNRFLKLDVTVTNPGSQAERYRLELVHETGGVLTSKEIDVPPGESRATTLTVVPVEVGPLELTVRLIRGGEVLQEKLVTVEVVETPPESPSPTPTQTPPPTQATPSLTPTESPSPTPPATEGAEGEQGGEGGIPKAALAVGAVAVAVAAAALALRGRRPGAPAPTPTAPAAPTLKPAAAQREESEEIRKIREKLEALEKAKAEGRISERTYRELRDKYESELEKLLGGA